MTGESVNLKAMVYGDLSVDGVQHSSQLLRFVDAVLTNPDDVDDARTDLRLALSDAAFVDACATLASFNAVVKVADGTGIPLEDYKAEKTAQMRKDLQIDQLRDRGYLDEGRFEQNT